MLQRMVVHDLLAYGVGIRGLLVKTVVFGPNIRFWLFMRLALVVLGVLISTGVTVVSSPKAISLRLRNPICATPCTVVMVITADPKQVNNGEWMCIALQDDFPEPTRISCWPYDGRLRTEVRIKDIPEGIYEVQAATRHFRDNATLEVH